MQKYYYGYEQFRDDIKELVSKCKAENFDAILGISRGGLTASHFLGEGLGLRKVYAINAISYKSRAKLDSIEIFNLPNLKDVTKILIVDDIADSGETLKEILKTVSKEYPNKEFKTATLFYKKSSVIAPDFWVNDAKEWIDFFWEVDLFK